MKKILVATRNPAKYRDFAAELTKEGFVPMSLQDAGITQTAPEDQPTYEANSLQKARFYHTIAGLPTLADDGGFELDFLDGEPGVRSRRWAGYEMTDEEIIQMAVEKMASAPIDQRGCQLRTVVTLVTDNGYWQAEAATRAEYREPTVERMKGYPVRSIMYFPEQQKYFVQFNPEEASQISHRTRAIQKLFSILHQQII